ncbi:MAG: hypothetical protein WB392_07265 [Methanotrichaceae archaeon]
MKSQRTLIGTVALVDTVGYQTLIRLRDCLEMDLMRAVSLLINILFSQALVQR